MLIRNTGEQQKGSLLIVVGVVADCNFNSLHPEITPHVLTNQEFRIGSGLVAVRLYENEVPQTREKIEEVGITFVPELGVNIAFLDAQLEVMYQADEATSEVIVTSTI